MVRTGIQLRSFRELSPSLSTTIARVGETAIDGVELFDPDVAAPAAVERALEASSLEPIGAHVPIGRLECEYDAVVETYETIGCRRLIVPIADPDAFASVDGVRSVARRLDALAARASDDGFDVCYHNHAFEFTRLGDATAYEVLVEETGSLVDLEVDTGLAKYGGAEPTDLLSRFGERISLVHLTDSVPGRRATVQVELGAGIVDVDGCVERAREGDVEWLVYEHGRTTDLRDSLIHAATKLPRLSRSPAGGGDSTVVPSTD